MTKVNQCKSCKHWHILWNKGLSGHVSRQCQFGLPAIAPCKSWKDKNE